MNSDSEKYRNSDFNGGGEEEERRIILREVWCVEMRELGGVFIEIPDGSDQFEYLIRRLILKYEFWIMCRKVHDSSKMNGPDAFPTTKLNA